MKGEISMNIDIVTADRMKVSSWSGGKTAEMFIYPPGASYSLRNLRFRVSSATVDADSSVFTSLPGINRFLTVINGNMELVSDNVNMSVRPYEPVNFDGGAHTVSCGKCVDFNLMLKDCKGSMSAVECAGKMQVELDSNAYTMLYCAAAELSVSVGSESYELASGNLMVIETLDGKSCLNVESGENVKLIKSVVYKENAPK